jgi:hypothetical protein
MFFDSITEEQAALLGNAPLFFVASAAPGLQDGPDGSGPVNVSPRAGVPLHLLSRNRVAFVDCRGSGNETVRHAEAGGAVTVMACSFEAENAAIVRLYGTARSEDPETSELGRDLVRKGVPEALTVRQVIVVDVVRTQTSCGYGVPVMEFVRDRQVADRGRAYK